MYRNFVLGFGVTRDYFGWEKDVFLFPPYLDNIQIGEESSLFKSEISTENKLSIFPNPTKGEATIVVENLAELDVQVSLVNILGAEVKQLFDGTIISNFQTINTELSSLEKGIYFVKVTHKGDIILTDKLILHK